MKIAVHDIGTRVRYKNVPATIEEFFLIARKHTVDMTYVIRTDTPIDTFDGYDRSRPQSLFRVMPEAIRPMIEEATDEH